jgi:hypothetical protein
MEHSSSGTQVPKLESVATEIHHRDLVELTPAGTGPDGILAAGHSHNQE